MSELRKFLQRTFEAPKFSDSNECAECVADQENDPNFGVFRRRVHCWGLKVLISVQHHCRKCGRSLCDVHCARKHDLPVFGLKEDVRFAPSRG